MLTRRDAALDLGLVLFVALLLPLGMMLGLGADVPGFSPDTGDVLILGKWFDALLLAGLAAYLLYRHRLPPAALGLQLARPLRQIAWALPTFVAIYASMIPVVVLILVLVTAFPAMQSDLQHRVEFVELLPHRYSRLVPLLVAVAIHEELLFRAVLLPYLRRLAGSWTPAVLISAALFASLHVSQGWLGVLQVFCVGTALSLFFVLSRSALAVMLAHFAFDFVQLLLIRLIPRILEQFPTSAPGT